MTVKRLMLVWVMILCLVPLGGWAEEETVEWFSESSELYNSRGEHFCFEIDGDHAVLTEYRVDPNVSQPAIVHVPDTLGGVPLTVIDSNAFNNYGGSYDDTKVECIVIPEVVVALRSDAFQCAHDVRRIELPSTLERIDGCACQKHNPHLQRIRQFRSAERSVDQHNRTPCRRSVFAV